MTKRVITLNPTMGTTTIYDVEAICDIWGKFASDYQVNDIEFEEMRLICTSCDDQDEVHFRDVAALMFKHAKVALCGSAEAKDTKVQKAVADTLFAWRVVANLGYFPRDVEELLGAWLVRENLEMRYDGRWYRNGCETKIDINYIGNQLILWNAKWKMGFAKDTIFAALDIFCRERQAEIRAGVAKHVAFDPSADPAKSELAKLVRAMIVPESGSDPAKIYRVAEMAMENTIYRVKNFLNGSSRAASAHLMVILFGEQGNGKSKFWINFFKPIGELFVEKFDMHKLNDNSYSYQLSVYPAVMFEEMAGADKTDVAHLKSVMDGGAAMMRESYARASVRVIEATMVGASNKDLRNSIKDETGNRRFIQFTTQLIDLKLLESFDFLKIWKSVDENAKEPPMYADKALLEDLKEAQEEQRVIGPVEQWILSGQTPNGYFTAGEAFTDFKLWCIDNGVLSVSAANYMTSHTLGTTISELSANRRYAGIITKKSVCKQNRYRVDLTAVAGTIGATVATTSAGAVPVSPLLDND